MKDREAFEHAYRDLGSVHYAQDEFGNVTHIVKRIDPELKEVYERLMRVRNPHLAVIMAISEENGEVFVHQELIRGEDLMNWNVKLDDEILLEIALDVTQALCAVHSLNPPIVHRDIKPVNIIHRDEGGFVLIDFDAGRIVKPDMYGDTRVMATVGYAAPEQYGLMQSDERSDIFSLGATLYWLKVGEPVRSGRKCPGKLGRIVDKCTQYEPEKRYPNTQALLKALQNLKKRSGKA